MTVIIDEIEAEVTPAREPAEAEPRPAEGGGLDEVLDQIELARERQERLCID